MENLRYKEWNNIFQMLLCHMDIAIGKYKPFIGYHKPYYSVLRRDHEFPQCMPHEITSS